MTRTIFSVSLITLKGKTCPDVLSVHIDISSGRTATVILNRVQGSQTLQSSDLYMVVEEPPSLRLDNIGLVIGLNKEWNRE